MMLGRAIKNAIYNKLNRHSMIEEGSLKQLKIAMDAPIFHFQSDVVVKPETHQILARLPASPCFVELSEHGVCVQCLHIKTSNKIEMQFFYKPKINDLVFDIAPVKAFVDITDEFQLVGSSIDALSVGFYPQKQMDEQDKKEHKRQAVGIALKVLSALTFLNCRNVTTVKIDPDYKAVERRKRENKPFMVSYYVAKLKNTRHQSNTTGCGVNNNRWHLCRGHFKKRKSGVFWWNHFMRGDKTLGKVDKDYQVV